MPIQRNIPGYVRAPSSIYEGVVEGKKGVEQWKQVLSNIGKQILAKVNQLKHRLFDGTWIGNKEGIFEVHKSLKQVKVYVHDNQNNLNSTDRKEIIDQLGDIRDVIILLKKFGADKQEGFPKITNEFMMLHEFLIEPSEGGAGRQNAVRPAKESSNYDNPKLEKEPIPEEVKASQSRRESIVVGELPKEGASQVRSSKKSAIRKPGAPKKEQHVRFEDSEKTGPKYKEPKVGKRTGVRKSKFDVIAASQQKFETREKKLQQIADFLHNFAKANKYKVSYDLAKEIDEMRLENNINVGEKGHSFFREFSKGKERNEAYQDAQLKLERLLRELEKIGDKS